MRSLSASPPRTGPRRLTPLLRSSLLLLPALLLLTVPAFAQGPSVGATMATVKAVVIALLKALMVIGTVIALLKVTKNFLSGNPNSFTSLLWLCGGVVVFFTWGGFFSQKMGTWTSTVSTVGNMGNHFLVKEVSIGAYMMAEKILSIMLTTVVPLLLFVTVAGTVIRGFISSGQVQFEIGPIFRVFFMFVMLANYNNLAPLIGNLIGGVADIISDSRPGGSPLSQANSAYDILNKLRVAKENEQAPQNGGTVVTPNDAATATADSQSFISSMASTIADKLGATIEAFSPARIIMGFATDVVTAIIQSIMEFLQSFLLGFLYACGPIAIAFSFVPGFGGVAKHWLQSLVGVHMWSVAFQAISALFIHYQIADVATTSVAGAMSGLATAKFTVACLVFIIMYLMVPYMSSLIVGSSGADGFVGSAMRLASTVASAGAGAAIGAASAVGSGAQAANAVSAAGGTGSTAGNFARGMANSVGGGQSSKMGMGDAVSQMSQFFGGGSAPQMPGAAQEHSGSSQSRETNAAGSSGTTVPSPTTAAAQPAQAAAGQPARAPSMSGTILAQQAASAGGSAVNVPSTTGQTAAATAAAQQPATVGATAAAAGRPPSMPGPTQNPARPA